MSNLGRRALHGLLLLMGVSLLSFGLLSVAPGNFYDELRLNPQISPDTVAALKAEYGMDRPWPERYGRWLVSIAKGEFGYSSLYRRQVGPLIWPRARNTLLLTLLATLLAWMIALPWGILEALNRDAWVDRTGAVLTAILLAIPDVLLGLMLLLLAAKTRWFPTGGMASLGGQESPFFLTRIWDVSVHLFLPVLALVLATLPTLVRHVRSGMISALESPFLEAARACGIPRWRVIARYAFPVAMNSLISLLGISVGGLLSMSLLMEVVLGWPGLGPLVLEAMLARDIYVVMAAVTLSSVFLVSGNLLADALLYWHDPRIREVAA